MKKEMQAKENMKKKKKKLKIKRFFRFIFLIILIAIIIYGISFAIKMNKHKAAMEEGEVEYDPLSAIALGIDPDKLKEVGRLNVLVVGESDANQGLPDPAYFLADTIMVVSYNPQTQQAAILSIPRDTYVGKNKANASASDKINCAYRNKTKMENLLNAVNDLTGLEIDKYVTVDTAAIREIVDAVGGITFNVPIDMDYDDDSQDLYIHLQAGEQLLDGEKAEHLLRFRHNNDMTSYDSEYGDNDFGRMRTQREFIQEAAKQILKIENAPKAVNLMEIVFKNVETNIDMDTMKYYIPYVFKFNPENIQSDYVPGASQKLNGVWLYIADKAETKQVVEDLFTDRQYVEEEQEETTQEANNTQDAQTQQKQEEKKTETKEEQKTETKQGKGITIEVLNGTGKKDNLSKVCDKLKEAGYDVTKMGETSVTESTMIINRTKKDSSISNDIKGLINTGSVTSGSDNSKVDFTIILGNDYN